MSSTLSMASEDLECSHIDMFYDTFMVLEIYSFLGELFRLDANKTNLSACHFPSPSEHHPRLAGSGFTIQLA